MYVKLFSSLYQGTLRGRSDEILVFTNLLAHADQYGIVDKHWRAISEETGLSRERVDVAILNLEAPDPESRSPEMDGCRIVRLDDHRAWGWKVVNYGKYRSIRNEDDRKEQNRQAQERWRNKSKITVSGVSHGNPPSSQAEAKAEAKAEANNSKTLASSAKALSAGKQKVIEVDPTPVIEIIPLVGGIEYEVRQSIVAEWERLFPAVDVPQTLREIRAWNLANPTKRKTIRGIVVHITGWLAKEQNKPEPTYRR